MITALLAETALKELIHVYLYRRPEISSVEWLHLFDLCIISQGGLREMCKSDWNSNLRLFAYRASAQQTEITGSFLISTYSTHNSAYACYVVNTRFFVVNTRVKSWIINVQRREYTCTSWIHIPARATKITKYISTIKNW